jgi:hypothetical protein
LPADLSAAIEHANRICQWQENLMPDEMPPHWMWHLDGTLDDWFAEVERKREDRHHNPEGAVNDDSSGSWVENEYAKGRR